MLRLITGRALGRPSVELLADKHWITLPTITGSVSRQRLDQYTPMGDNHRVPYEVAGDEGDNDLGSKDYMLLCGSCNRAKSWSCEHCINWIDEKRPQVCRACYWAKPESYSHIALREVRRLDLLWEEDEVQTYERLKEIAKEAQYRMPEYVKRVIREHLGEE